jgi:hypothetical protein
MAESTSDHLPAELVSTSSLLSTTNPGRGKLQDIEVFFGFVLTSPNRD